MSAKEVKYYRAQASSEAKVEASIEKALHRVKVIIGIRIVPSRRERVISKQC